LSYDTRKQKRYEAIKKWSKETGKAPYQRIKGATFKDYLEQSTPEFRRQYLGPKRAKDYEAGTLSLDNMIKPDSGYKKNTGGVGKRRIDFPKTSKRKTSKTYFKA
jgi:hypothetical protein